MNTMLNKGQKLALLILISLNFFSCEDSIVETKVAETGFVTLLATKAGSDVLVTVKDLMSGEISGIGNGIEQNGWRSSAQVNETILSWSYNDNKTMIGYTFEDSILTEKGRFVFYNRLSIISSADENTAIAIQSPRSGFEKSVIYKINTNTMEIIDTVKHEIYQSVPDSLTAWATGVVRQEDKLFISFYLKHAGGWSTPDNNMARIAVFNYPELTFDKYITDDRAAGVGHYAHHNGIFETNNGDIYSYSTASNASGFANPTPTKPSGFLRVLKGTSEFDSNYFFDFESASGGNKLNSVVYAGGDIAVVRMVSDDSGLWATFKPTTENPICKLAVVNFRTKTVKEVSNVPLHGGQWFTPGLLHNGKVYMNIGDVNGAYIYQIDPLTAIATKGAKAVGTEFKGLFSLELK